MTLPISSKRCIGTFLSRATAGPPTAFAVCDLHYRFFSAHELWITSPLSHTADVSTMENVWRLPEFWMEGREVEKCNMPPGVLQVTVFSMALCYLSYADIGREFSLFRSPLYRRVSATH